jgi:predicted metal-dependent HD superfamily phosphohydrolase
MTRDDLVAAYSAPGRHYHNMRHIEDCLGMLTGVDKLLPAQREILTEAIWWHDVVYDTTRSDNEELSAAGAAGEQLADGLRTHHVRAARFHFCLCGWSGNPLFEFDAGLSNLRRHHRTVLNL